jgi:hypothetical protein
MSTLKRGFRLDRKFYKKGMDDKLMFTMWEIIVVLMVVTVLTISVRGISNDTTYWKKYHSTDLALMTDIISPMNGDFIINYEIKDLNTNFATKILKLETLRFMIYLRDGAYYVYDESASKDRFPQSYVFSQDRDRTVTESNITSDYVVLYKQGNIISLKTDYVSSGIICPTMTTTSNLKEIYFDTKEVTLESKSYSDYISTFLKNTGTGTNKESLFFIETNTENNIIYYDDTSDKKSKSEKMACIIRRNIIKNDTTIKVDIKPYSSIRKENPVSELISTTFEQSNYNYYVYIKLDTEEFSEKKISELMKLSIEEYYK